ncbi:MAG: hypothetical protein ACYSW2_16045, partial [Planctomycetota bacterium]
MTTIMRFIVVVATLSRVGEGMAQIKVAVERNPASASSNEGAIKVANALNDDTHFDFDAVIVGGTDIDTNDELNQYDVVVIGDGGDPGQDDLDIFASALRTWVENGGGVVGLGWIIYEAGETTGPPVPEIDVVVPVNTFDFYNFFAGATQVITDDSHPVTQGVTDFIVNGCCIEYPSAPQVDPGAVVLGTTNGEPTIVVFEGPSNGKSVYLGPAYSGGNVYSTDMYGPSGDRLLEQAVAWVAVPPDSDGDGIPDDEDACPDSILTPTIVINGCDSGVTNVLFEDGCTMSD